MGDELISAMNPESPEQLLFAEALQHATIEARVGYLESACANDTPLRSRVEALLRASDDAGDFLEPSPVGLSGEIHPGSLGIGENGITQSFGDYELLEEIARGGMGVVYKARQKSLERLVALKVLLFGRHSSADLVRRFKVEAVAAGSLNHPNIIAIHEVGIHQGQHFMVVDYVAGPNLGQLAGGQPLPSKRAATYVKQIAETIHYAHERGILHRDLKPSNVLIDSNDQPRVTDFGLALRLDEDSTLTLTGQVLGSPNFIPPEQVSPNRGKVGRRSDVYGLGAILYHLLSGRPPFQGENLSATLDQVLHSDPTPLRILNSLVPPDLETICMKCLEKEPSKRFPTAKEVADDLDRFLNNEPILTSSLAWTNFDKTLWVNSEYVRGYLDQADQIIPERRYMFHIVCSFLRHFIGGNFVQICDLGCGDGVLGRYLLDALPGASLTLVDGAPGMLDAARSRLGNRANVRFIHSTFDSIINGESALGPFDCIVSSFAIHHLTQAERTALFFRLQKMLPPGGWFLNVDTVSPDVTLLEDWHYELWREWILETEKHQPRPDSLRDVPDKARHNPDNKLTALASQLNALRRAEFDSVDCLYRNGIFAVYAARRPVGPGEIELRATKESVLCMNIKPRTICIGLIGDYHPEVTAHRAIARSLELIRTELDDWQIVVEWLATDSIEKPANRLSAFDGLWCVPASPYASMDGALKAIQFAREHDVPFLGTCAGFQHILFEYARNVLGLPDADHEETRPDAACKLVSRLSSPMVERDGRVSFEGSSRLREIYGRDSSVEMYHCNFGLSHAYESRLQDGQLCFSARDSEGGVHAVELRSHPFFMGTLFQPERQALEKQVHPLVRAFVLAAQTKNQAENQKARARR